MALANESHVLSQGIFFYRWEQDNEQVWILQDIASLLVYFKFIVWQHKQLRCNLLSISFPFEHGLSPLQQPVMCVCVCLSVWVCKLRATLCKTASPPPLSSPYARFISRLLTWFYRAISVVTWRKRTIKSSLSLFNAWKEISSRSSRNNSTKRRLSVNKVVCPRQSLGSKPLTW